jgi:hypothetical protein
MICTAWFSSIMLTDAAAILTADNSLETKNFPAAEMTSYFLLANVSHRRSTARWLIIGKRLGNVIVMYDRRCVLYVASLRGWSLNGGRRSSEQLMRHCVRSAVHTVFSKLSNEQHFISESQRGLIFATVAAVVSKRNVWQDIQRKNSQFRVVYILRSKQMKLNLEIWDWLQKQHTADLVCDIFSDVQGSLTCIRHTFLLTDSSQNWWLYAKIASLRITLSDGSYKSSFNGTAD